jgi:gliding motility-associated-like protein
MKLLLLFFLMLTLTNCKKSNVSNLINCNELVTDTAGTGDNGRVFMPTAFTPNNDGLNDIIRPLTQNITSLEFTIFDESNNVLFATTTIGEGWASTAAVNIFTQYYYRVQATTTANHKIGLCGQLFKLTCIPGGFTLNMFRFEDQITASGFIGVTNETLGTCP